MRLLVINGLVILFTLACDQSEFNKHMIKHHPASTSNLKLF